MKKPRLLAVLSDLHVGSDYSLMPPGYFTKSGNKIGLNPIQEWIWECWQDCWKWFDELKGEDKWSIVLNGDLIDGYHHGTKEIWTHDEGEHGVAAYHVLKDVCKTAQSVFITEGTESHSKSHEHAIAKMLISQKVNVVTPDAVKGAWPSLDLTFAGTHCRFDHHIGTTARSYLEASQYSIAMGNARNECGRAGHDIPKVFCRAHRHRFGVFNDGYGMLAVTPPWQTLTRFGRKVVTEAVPQIGMVVLDWRQKEDDSIPLVHHRLHTIKQPSPVTV